MMLLQNHSRTEHSAPWKLKSQTSSRRVEPPEHGAASCTAKTETQSVNQEEVCAVREMLRCVHT
jgi:hypothetical protein